MTAKITNRLIAIVTLSLLAANILAIIIFFDSISITAHDLCPAIFFVIHVIIIILAFHYEHEPNKLLVFLLDFVFFHSTRAFFPKSKNEIYNKKTFRLALLIHCSLLPFYLPTAFLTYKLQCVIPTIVLFFIPKLVSSVYDTIYFFTTAHKNKLRQQQKDAQYEKERLEQERREELGKWK